MPQLELKQWSKRVIIAIVVKLETPPPNSWLAGLGRNRRSVARVDEGRQRHQQRGSGYRMRQQGAIPIMRPAN
jgi:hypothetical protein